MDESFDAHDWGWRQMVGEIASWGLMAKFDFLRWSWLFLACTSCVVIRDFEAPSELASSAPPLSADISAPLAGERRIGEYRIEGEAVEVKRSEELVGGFSGKKRHTRDWKQLIRVTGAEGTLEVVCAERYRVVKNPGVIVVSGLESSLRCELAGSFELFIQGTDGEYGGHFQAASYGLEVTSNGDAKGYVLRAGSEPIAAVRTVFGAKPGAVWISERAPKDRRLELVAALSALLAFKPHFPPS